MQSISSLFSLGSLAFLLFSSFQSVPFTDIHPIEETVGSFTVNETELEHSQKIEEYLKNIVPGLDHSYRDIFNMIIKEGHNVWLTGGAIRDLLAPEPSAPNDLDFTFDCTRDEIQRILRTNGVPYIIPNSYLINIGLKDTVNMGGLESIYAFHAKDEELEFTVNTVHYHLNTSSFEGRFKKGLKDLIDKKIIVKTRDLDTWLYGWPSARPTKIFRYWKMRGKGFHSVSHLERFIVYEAVKAFKQDPEAFRMQLLNYLGTHFSCFGQIRNGCAQTMGAKWCRENYDSLYLKAQAIDTNMEILWNDHILQTERKVPLFDNL